MGDETLYQNGKHQQGKKKKNKKLFCISHKDWTLHKNSRQARESKALETYNKESEDFLKLLKKRTQICAFAPDG